MQSLYCLSLSVLVRSKEGRSPHTHAEKEDNSSSHSLSTVLFFFLQFATKHAQMHNTSPPCTTSSWEKGETGGDASPVTFHILCRRRPFLSACSLGLIHLVVALERYSPSAFFPPLPSLPPFFTTMKTMSSSRKEFVADDGIRPVLESRVASFLRGTGQRLDFVCHSPRPSRGTLQRRLPEQDNRWRFGG